MKKSKTETKTETKEPITKNGNEVKRERTDEERINWAISRLLTVFRKEERNIQQNITALIILKKTIEKLNGK